MLRKTLLMFFVFLLVTPIFAQDTLIGIGTSDDLGEFATGADGMTLYIFTRDPLGESVCNEQCAQNWPPVVVESVDELTAPDDFAGEWGTVERADGTLQASYNGLPLYYFSGDEAEGDTNGQARGNVWWVVAPADVYLLDNADLGHILVSPDGRTLYLFTNDVAGSGESACYEQCAENWPPLTVETADDLVGDPRLPGELGTIERTDETLQVTYNGWPLYYWKDDAAPGDILGEGRGEVWYAVSPETVVLSGSDELGDFLVAPNGMTLYLFSNDEAGVSNCTDTCLENWPAYTLYAGDRLVAPAGVEGELGTIDRGDGVMQITYNGMPLYYFAQDMAPGDTVGQGRGDVWWVVAP